MQRHLEIPGNDQPLVDAESRISHAPGPAQHHRHRRKRLKSRALVHEFELARIERVHADANAERVDDALALPVAHLDVGRPIGHDLFVIEVRFWQFRLPPSHSPRSGAFAAACVDSISFRAEGNSAV